jgi:hypothetical protein
MNRFYIVFMAALATAMLILGWQMEGWISNLIMIFGGFIAGHVVTDLLNGE